MNFGKKIFLSLSAFVCAISFDCNGAFAIAANGCERGGQYQYCGFGRSCKTCPANCYCPPRNKASDEACTGWTAIYCRSDKGIYSNSNATITNGSFGINLCPLKFPYSDEGSSSENDCYTMLGDIKAYKGKTISCTKGKYKPAGTGKDEDCKKGWVCTGKPATVTDDVLTKDLCATHCVSGTEPNKETGADECVSICKEEGTKYGGPGKGCVSMCAEGSAYDKETKQCVKSVVCDAGTYLPKGAERCVDCKLGYACPGGEFAPKPTEDMGTTECQINSEKVSDDKTQCIVTGANCKPGNYLPGGRQECKPCSGTNKYCPGGGFDIAEIDQGIADCPYGGKVNSEKSGCKLSVTKDIMMYGYSGAQLGAKDNIPLMDQCWTRSDIEDFSRCVLGN